MPVISRFWMVDAGVMGNICTHSANNTLRLLEKLLSCIVGNSCAEQSANHRITRPRGNVLSIHDREQHLRCERMVSGRASRCDFHPILPGKMVISRAECLFLYVSIGPHSAKLAGNRPHGHSACNLGTFISSFPGSVNICGERH